MNENYVRKLVEKIKLEEHLQDEKDEAAANSDTN